jgi:hypothetical protein
VHLYAARQSPPALPVRTIKEPDSYNLNLNRMRRALEARCRLTESGDKIRSRLIYLLSKSRTANVIALRIRKLNNHRSGMVVDLSNDHMKIIVIRLFLEEQNDARNL